LPIVGEAIIRVRVSSSQLASDIRNAVRDGFRATDKDIDSEGERLGKRFSNSIGNGIRDREDGLGQNISSSVRRSTIAAGSRVDDHGATLGRRFSNAVGSGVRDNEDRLGTSVDNSIRRIGRRAGTSIGSNISGALRAASPSLQQAGAQVGAQAGQAIQNGITRNVNRNRGGILSQFHGLGKDIGQSFNLGIGAARMGPAVIAALIAIGPSLISGVGAILTAVLADVINFAAAIGPGLAGGIGLGLAGISTLALNLGLLKLAFGGNTAQAKAFKAEVNTLKETLTASFAPQVLSGFTDAVKTLGSTLLPAVNDELKATGTAMGDIARGLAATVTSSANLGRIKGILATNTTFLQNFGQGLNGIATSFLILFNASKPFVDFLGTSIKRFGEWASASLAVSEANGSLATWMDGMLASFKDLARIVANFGGGLRNIFRAAAPAGQSLLDSIRGIAERFHAWTSDTTNMARMEAFFTKARTLASKVYDLLGAIFTAGGRAFEGMDLGPILHALDVLKDTVAPAIARIFKQIQTAVGPSLVKIFDNLGVTFTKIADSGVIGKVAEAVGALFLALSNLFATDFGAQIAGLGLAFLLFGGILKPIIEVLGVLGRFVPVLAGLSAPVLAVVAAFAAAAGVFLLAWTNSEKFRAAVEEMGTTLREKLAPIVEVVGESFGRLWEAIQRLGKALGDFLAPIIKNIITPVLVALGDIIGGVLAVVLENLTLLADFLTGVISGDWQPFADELRRLQLLIQGWWIDFVNWFSGAWDTFWNDTLPKAWEDFKTEFARQWDEYWTVVIPRTWDQFATAMSDAWDQFWNTDLPNLWDTFSTWFSAQWHDALERDIPGTWDAFVANVGPSWDTFWNDTLPHAWDIFKEKMNTFWTVDLPGVLTTALNGIQTFFADFWTTTIPNIFTDFTDKFRPLWDKWWGEVSTGWLNDFSFADEWPKFWSETVPKAFDNFSSSFGATWDNFWQVTLPNAAGQLGINLLNEIDDLTSDLGTWLSGLGSGFGADWDEFWNVTLPNAVGQLGIDVLNSLTDFGPGLGTWFTTWTTNLGTEWMTFWQTTLPGFVSGLWTGVNTELDTMTTNIGNWFSGWTSSFGTSWNDFWGTTLPDFMVSLTVKGADPLEAFKTMVSGKWDEFTTWFGGLWDKFWGTDLPDKVDPVTPAVAGKWEEFKAMLSGKWQEFKDWLGGLWDSFWGSDLPNKVDQVTPAVSTKLDVLKGMINQKWEDIKSGVGQKIDELKASISQQWEDIKTAVMGKVNSLITDVNNLFTGWGFPDIGALLQEHIVKPFQTAWEDISRLVGQITGATNVLNTAKSALDSANAALGNAVAGTPVANPQFVTTTRSVAGSNAVRSVLGWEGIGGGLLRALQAMPGLATGGIVPATPGGSVFRLAEAGRPERVEPLDSSGLSNRDRAMIKSIVGATVSMMSGGGVNVDVTIGEKGLDQFVTQTIRREESNTARRYKAVKR
jgi:hypothetical protein